MAYSYLCKAIILQKLEYNLYFNYANIHAISPMVYIYIYFFFRTWMHFLRVNVTFYDAVNMIHDVITSANPFPYTAKFIFVGVTNDKTQ